MESSSLLAAGGVCTEFCGAGSLAGPLVGLLAWLMSALLDTSVACTGDAANEAQAREIPPPKISVDIKALLRIFDSRFIINFEAIIDGRPRGDQTGTCFVSMSNTVGYPIC